MAAACTSPRAQVLSDSSWLSLVKTVSLTRSGVELEPPVLTLGPSGTTSERLLLQFDLLADEGEYLHYSIAHCDALWHPDNLPPHEFINGFHQGEIENIEFSFGTLRPYVHYHQTLPAPSAAFTHSGNYIIAVTNDHGDTLLTHRFWVSEQSVRVEAEITKPYDGIALSQRQELDVLVETQRAASQFLQLRPEYERVLVQQNGRLDNQRWLQFSGYDGRALAFRYRQCNIFDGGNTFRFFDCSNLHAPMYNVQRIEEYGGELFALLRPEEDRSKKHFLSETTLNGGMKVNAVDRSNKALQAEYVWVNISLPVKQPWIDRSVYVVGQLTDWKLDSASRMDYVPEYKAYVKRLLLKQGYYAYQLLVGGKETGDREIRRSATETLEGDHMETPNQYTIFVYHREPSDRADRLVAVRRIQ